MLECQLFLAFSNDFLVCIQINDIHNLDIKVFDFKQFCDKM